MKPLRVTLITACLLLLVLFTSAQGKYTKVKIYPPADKVKTSRLMGLLQIDHFHDEAGGAIITEIGQPELDKLRSTGFQFEILNGDIEKDLLAENKKYFEDRQKGLIRADGSPAGDLAGRVAIEQAGNTVANIIATPSAFQVQSGSPNLGGYYTFAQMNTAMNALVAAYPALASKTSLGLSIEGRDIWCIKISDNVLTDEANEPEVLYMGLQHAREAIGGSSMIFFMQYLCEQYAVNSRIKDLVDNREIYIIPCMNPDGWEYNRSTNPNGGGMWRKNRKIIATGPTQYGVDLNRNWGVDWANCPVSDLSCGDPSPVTANDTYWGSSAFSEPETQAVRTFVKTRNFVAMIDQHAYGPYYSLPFGRPSLHTGADSLTLMDQQFYTHIPALMGKYNGMRAGNSDQSVGYEVAGGVKDWMLKGEIGVGTKGKVYGMTGEGGYGAAAVTFWPPAAQIINLCKGMTYQNLQLLFSAGSYVDIQDAKDIALSATSGTLDFKIKRIGLANQPVTVTAIPLINISAVGSPVVINSLPGYYDTYAGNISYTLPGSITSGQRVKFAWKVETGGYTYYDTITKFYNPVQLFADNMETGIVSTNWVVSAGWNYVTDSGYAATRALTESPGAKYPASVTTARTARYNGTLNLSDASAAFLVFQTKHRAENFRDKLQIQVSPDGTTWTAIAGKTTIQEPGTLESSTINGQPALTGIKDDWVNEVFDLSAYLTQPALRFRFAFTSDASGSFYAAQDEGFYIDNLKVIKSTTPLVTLGVDFLTFSGRLLPGNDIQLNWQANADNQHSHFEVEKSGDSRNFSFIGRVETNQPFTFTDEQPSIGNNYYRLKGVAVNGEATYSRIINIIYKPDQFELSLFPNPVKEELNIRIRTTETERLTVELSDLSGRKILSQQVIADNSNRTTSIRVAHLTSQFYILRVINSSNEIVATEKFVKQ